MRDDAVAITSVVREPDQAPQPHPGRGRPRRRPGTARDGRLTFLSAPLPTALRVSGTASVTLRIAVDRPTTNLSVRLVDYGTARRVNYDNPLGGVIRQPTESCWGESTIAGGATR